MSTTNPDLYSNYTIAASTNDISLRGTIISKKPKRDMRGRILKKYGIDWKSWHSWQMEWKVEFMI
jgi:hypothetical protein